MTLGCLGSPRRPPSRSKTEGVSKRRRRRIARSSSTDLVEARDLGSRIFPLQISELSLHVSQFLTLGRKRERERERARARWERERERDSGSTPRGCPRSPDRRELAQHRDHLESPGENRVWSALRFGFGFAFGTAGGGLGRSVNKRS